MLNITTEQLGHYRVVVGTHEVPAHRWKHRHVRLLWQMLCLADGHRVSRDEACEALWPQSAVQASSNRLYHTLHGLRNVLGEAAGTDGKELVQLQAGTLCLGAGLVIDTDVQRFEAMVEQARRLGDGEPAAQWLQQARQIHRGALALPPGAGAWFEPRAKALQRSLVWLLECLAQMHQQAARLDEAVRVNQELLQAEPINEAAHRRLIALHAAQGRADLAAQQYAACSRHLRRELGIDPSEATQAQMRAATEHAKSVPPGAPSEGHVRAVTPFVAPRREVPLLGREVELAELAACLQSASGPQLITITAAGGVGKTRLAAALAETVQGRYGDGVCFVPLGDLPRGSRLSERVAQALGLPSSARPVEEALLQALATKHLLLVLDRFEHLVEAVPQVAKWLQGSVRLHIVITSQRALKLRSERLFELQPLSMRAPQAAVELFVRTAARAGIELDLPRHEASVWRVCQQLGGNALAIELAAAQLVNVPLHALEGALQQPLHVLTGPAPDDEPQHAGLQAALDWSVSLLEPDAARLLRLCAVFAADFSGDDAQAVLGALMGGATVQPLLRSLVERHLLTAGQEHEESGQRRFGMPDAVRDVARQQVRSDAHWPGVRQAHAAHFAAVVEAFFEQVSKGQAGPLRGAYQAASPDIACALDWLRNTPDAEAALRTAWHAAVVQLTLGAVREGIESLQWAVHAEVRDRAAMDQAAWCHYVLARALTWGGDYGAALRPLRKARRLAKGSADGALHDRISRFLSALWIGQLRIDEALRLIEGSIRRLTREQRIDSLASAYVVLGSCFDVRGHYESAAAATERALECAQQAQNPHSAALALLSLANLDMTRGELDLAEESLRDTEPLCQVVGSPLLLMYLGLAQLALAFERCRFDECAAHVAHVQAVCRDHLAERNVVVELWREFLMLETGDADGVRLVLEVTDQQLPFDADHSLTYVWARAYRIQEQARRHQWSAAAASLAALQQLVQRAGSPLWASWLAESAAHAAHRVGRGALATDLLVAARRLQADIGVRPTPRQVRRWQALERMVGDASPTLPPHGDDEAVRLARQLEGLLVNLLPRASAVVLEPVWQRMEQALRAAA